MSFKQKPVRICDSCGKEIDEINDFLHIEDVHHEGNSEMRIMSKTKGHNKNIFEFAESDYCHLGCFISDIKKVLKIED